MRPLGFVWFRSLQAERERKARVILGTAEPEISEKFAKASKEYRDNPVALHLRGMNMLLAGLKEKGSMVIVPSSVLDSMNLGAMGAWYRWLRIMSGIKCLILDF